MRMRIFFAVVGVSANDIKLVDITSKATVRVRAPPVPLSGHRQKQLNET